MAGGHERFTRGLEARIGLRPVLSPRAQIQNITEAERGGPSSRRPFDSGRSGTYTAGDRVPLTQETDGRFP
jgi:hypothetical protein